MTFMRWRSDVAALMDHDYAITLDDAGLATEDLLSHFRGGSDPMEFVRWFAEKYDLTSVADWLAFR